MEHVIHRKIEDIETQENVKVILAVESGSRAWGFASPDSDYDVRFLYVRPEEFYLRLDPARDVIEWQLDDVLDINGWDIKKALKLLYASNPVLFEWCASPVIYWQREEFSAVSALLNDYFCPKKTLLHYLHMAKNNYREYLRGNRVKAKKYFYVLRPILAAIWIAERGTAPPVPFDDLLAAMLPESLLGEVTRLLVLKKQLAETAMVDKIAVLNAFIEKQQEVLAEKAEGMKSRGASSWQPLNCAFVQLLQQTHKK